MSINNSFMGEAGVTKILVAATAKATLNILFKNHSTTADAKLTVRRVLRKDVGVSQINVTSAGSAYVFLPTITVDAPAVGDTAIASAYVGLGAMSSIADAGSGYKANDVLSFTDGDKAIIAGTATVNDVDGSGAIQSIAVTLPGEYSSFPVQPMAAAGGNGSGAKAQFNFQLAKVVITSSGAGYVEVPSVAVSGSATAKAVLGPNMADYQKIEDAVILPPKASLYWRAVAVQLGTLITVESDTDTVSANAWGIDGL